MLRDGRKYTCYSKNISSIRLIIARSGALISYYARYSVLVQVLRHKNYKSQLLQDGQK